MILTREPQNGKQTIGTLDFEGVQLKTMELKWNDNKRGASCIPPTIEIINGKEKRVLEPYNVVPRTSSKYSHHFIILGTEPRKYVLFHPANYSRQLRGCIAPGMKHRDIDGDGLTDVVSSKKAMNILLEKFPQGFEFDIIQKESPKKTTKKKKTKKKKTT